MGVDTKGFLVTKEKNPFKIWKVIKASIIQDMLEKSNADGHIGLWNRKQEYKLPTADLQDFSEMVDICFTYVGEERRMVLFLDCDSDYDEVHHGKKIILSLGCWGSSVHLIEVVLRGLKKEFGGRAFIVDNDCSDDWRKIK